MQRTIVSRPLCRSRRVQRRDLAECPLPCPGKGAFARAAKVGSPPSMHVAATQRAGGSNVKIVLAAANPGAVLARSLHAAPPQVGLDPELALDYARPG